MRIEWVKLERSDSVPISPSYEQWLGRKKYRSITYVQVPSSWSESMRIFCPAIFQSW